jgi:hypothetical protein
VNQGIALLLLGVLFAGTAAAEPGPQLIPTRDVDITYRVTREGRTLSERVRWLAADRLERVDAAGPVYMLVDHKARRLTLVNDDRRAVLEMEVPRGRLLDPESASGYTRAGEGQVAGLACTNWRLPTGGDTVKQICVTGDGVLLQIQDQGQTIVEATVVDYRPVDAGTFRVPAGYAETPPPAAAPSPPDTGAAPSER